MADYTYDTPRETDIIYLSENLRPEDRRELFGMTGPDFESEIRHCVDSSECCWVCRRDGKVMAMFGVICTNPMERHGIVWMLASTETAKHKIYTGKWTKKGINALMQDWNFLYNYVDEGNTDTIEWLKWMGAEVHDPAPCGVYGVNYHLFTFTRR